MPEISFATRTFQIGELTAVVKHLGVQHDEEPPHQVRDWWEITVRGPGPGMEYQTTLGGSKDEYERRSSLRRTKEWGAGPLGHVLYDLNWAAEDPHGWYDFEIDGDAPGGRKAWDPRRDAAAEAAEKATEFIALAERFEGVIQPAFELYNSDWKTIASQALEENI